MMIFPDKPVGRHSLYTTVKQKPWHLFAFTACILILWSLIRFDKAAWHVMQHPSRFAHNRYLLRSLAMFLLLLWLLYAITSRFLYSGILIKMHVALTLFFVLLVISFAVLNKGILVNSMATGAGETKAGYAFMTMIIGLFFTQLLYFINLLAGMIRSVH